MIRNGDIFEMFSVGYVVIIVILIATIILSDAHEICSTFSGRRIYSDQNGNGSIQAVNVTASTLKNVRKASIEMKKAFDVAFKCSNNSVFLV